MIAGRDDALHFLGMRINPGSDFRHLSASARIQLAHDLWDSLDPAEVDAEHALTPEQEVELDERLANLERDRGAGVAWDQVRAEIEAEPAMTRRPRHGV